MLKLGRQEDQAGSIGSVPALPAPTESESATDGATKVVSCSGTSRTPALASPQQQQQKSQQQQIHCGRLKVATTGVGRHLVQIRSNSAVSTSLQSSTSGHDERPRFVVKLRPDFVPATTVSSQSSARPPPLLRAPQLHSASPPQNKSSFGAAVPTDPVEQSTKPVQRPVELAPVVPVASRAQRLSFLPSSSPGSVVSTAPTSIGAPRSALPPVSVSQPPTVLKLSYVPASVGTTATGSDSADATVTRTSDHAAHTTLSSSTAASSRRGDDDVAMPTAKRVRSSFVPVGSSSTFSAEDTSPHRRLPVLAHTYSRRSFSVDRTLSSSSTIPPVCGASPTVGSSAIAIDTLPKTRSRTEAELELNSRRTRRSSIITSSVNRL